jgi:hypothetical protein
LKKHTLWFHKWCSKSLYKRKQATSQWLQDLSEINGDNVDKARRECSGHIRSKESEYLKGKCNELAMNSKKKKTIRNLYRRISEFKEVTNLEVT